MRGERGRGGECTHAMRSRNRKTVDLRIFNAGAEQERG